MIEVVGNIWDYWEKGNWICITTNGTVKKNGEAVMGRGVALEAKNRFPDFPKLLGYQIKYKWRNIPHLFESKKIITFPVKHNWDEKADLNLIRASAMNLLVLLANYQNTSGRAIEKLYIPKPGCGNGRLDWVDVKKALEPILTSDKFIIISRE